MTNQNPATPDNELEQQWDSMSSGFQESSSGFLSGPEEIEVVEKSIDWLHPFDEALIPLGDYVVVALSWLVSNFRPAFQAIRMPVDYILDRKSTRLNSSHVAISYAVFCSLEAKQT